MRKKLEIPYEELYDLYITKNMKPEEISRIYNRTKPIIHTLLNNFDLIKYKNSILESKLSKENLYQMYIIDQMKVPEIAIKENIGQSVIRSRLEKHGITVQDQKDYYDSQIKINQLQHDVFIGSHLGDGSFNTYSGSTSLTVFHQEKQKDYCYKKFELLKYLCTREELSFSDRKNEKDDPNGNRQDQYYFYTKKLRPLNKYKNMSIIEAVSQLNANSLAIWYMDDGSLEIKNYHSGSGIAMIAMVRFTKEELEHTIKKFENDFNIYPKIKWKNKEKGIYSGLKFSVKDTHILCNIILDSDFGYIAKETMSYKVCEYKDMEDFTGNIPINCKSGVRGVYYEESRKRWRATHREKQLGNFDNFEDAVKAKEEAQKLDPIKYI